MNVVDRAFEVLAKASEGYRGVSLSEFVPDGDPRIAAPFGKPITMPAYEWRLSRDVWHELCDYAGMNDHDGPSLGARLLGETVTVDESLPPNSMLLEPKTYDHPRLGVTDLWNAAYDPENPMEVPY